jgi:hypothetical protein
VTNQSSVCLPSRFVVCNDHQSHRAIDDILMMLGAQAPQDHIPDDAGLAPAFVQGSFLLNVQTDVVLDLTHEGGALIIIFCRRLALICNA